jgi:hypothetical protein
MSASNGGLPVSSQQRDLMVQAAVAYDERKSASPVWRTNSIGPLPPWKQRTSRSRISISC